MSRPHAPYVYCKALAAARLAWFGTVAAAVLALATARAAPFGAILSRIWAPNYNLGSAPV